VGKGAVDIFGGIFMLVYVCRDAKRPKAGGDPEGAGDAVPLNHKREGVAPGTVGSHAPDSL